MFPCAPATKSLMQYPAGSLLWWSSLYNHAYCFLSQEVLNTFCDAAEQYSLLRRAFCDSFSSFALAVDKLWGSLLAQEPSQGLGQGMPRDIKLLVLQSNCVHLRTHILKDMVTRQAFLPTSLSLRGFCVKTLLVIFSIANECEWHLGRSEIRFFFLIPLLAKSGLMCLPVSNEILPVRISQTPISWTIHWN